MKGILGGISLRKTTLLGWPRRVGRYKLPRGAYVTKIMGLVFLTVSTFQTQAILGGHSSKIPGEYMYKPMISLGSSSIA